MSEYLIRTLLNDIDIDPPKKLSIKYPRFPVRIFRATMIIEGLLLG